MDVGKKLKPLLALAFAALPATGAAENYLGSLKPPRWAPAPAGLYSPTMPGFTPGFAAPGAAPASAWENGTRFKLGYRYSPYFSIEGEVSGSPQAVDLFASPTSLGAPFRAARFGLDTVATLPAWGLSFYGRMGAWHGEPAGFAPYSTALLGDGVERGTRWRYGLGMRYDFSRSLGVRAEVERYSAAGLGDPFATDDAEQFSVGLSWRF